MLPTTIAQLAIWTKKFAQPFLRLQNTALQKISATDTGELILFVYKPQDDRSLVVLSMKKGDSGITLTKSRPVTLKQPNSFVQISRKYLQGRKISSVYASISPICIIISFSMPLENGNNLLAHEAPDTLILDLDAKPPRLILAKKYSSVPERYAKECGKNFSSGEEFYESWCEWSEENTKTKRRAAFLFPLVGYCPLPDPATINPTVILHVDTENKSRNNKVIDKENINDINTALNYLPTHIRRSARTRLQFLERRLQRQKFDLPTEQQLARLKKQSEGLKNILYLWPKDSLTWYVPPQFIEEYSLNPIYNLKKGEKPSAILNNLFREIDILERRKAELHKRIRESENSLTHFQNLVIDCAKNIIENKLDELCKFLGIEVNESEQSQKLKKEKMERLPYRSYRSSTGQFIRVARSASDGELMLKQMPSNHYWLHVLTGEGSHIWLEKLKGEKKVSSLALREAGILAVHHSKHSRSQSGEVQFATRADIEKKKNLPVGKVLVRRCETFLIRYDDEELSKIMKG